MGLSLSVIKQLIKSNDAYIKFNFVLPSVHLARRADKFVNAR